MNTEKSFLIPEKEIFNEMFLTGFGFNYSNDIQPNTNFDNESN